MQLIKTVSELKDLRARSKALAIVPTMGALHDGHISLVETAKKHADTVLVSIFVNPAQFGPKEDLAAYPRMLETDMKKLEPMNIDAVYAPAVSEIYPEGFATNVTLTALTDCLCGTARPGHFDGVATVVSKLLLQSGADYGVFGEKDWQQLQVIRRIVSDLNIPCDIIGAPIYRDKDTGLALSSRNAYLSANELKSAAQLNVILKDCIADILAGKTIEATLDTGKEEILKAGFDSVDYLECRHAETLDFITNHDPNIKARLFAAAKIGQARLIDNMAV